MMEKEYVECMELAEKKNDMSFVIKGNGLKRKCDDKKQDIDVLEKQIQELEAKKKKLM